MKRNLVILDLVLLALCGVAMWRLLGFRRDRLADQARFLQRREAGVAPPAVQLSPAPEPAASSAYVEVAQKLLLSPDRNSNVIVDVVAPKPMPPLPRAYGAINFGQGPRVVLAERAGGQQKSYAVGERISEFKVLAITQVGVVFNWEGKRVAARYEEMRDLAGNAGSAAGSSASAQAGPVSNHAAVLGEQVRAANEAKSPASTNIAPTSEGGGKFGPGSESFRTCVSSDDSPSGTVVDGFRKTSIATPMGSSCRWEKVQ